ncbi:MAG: T9SS type A sorting domain-containing protein, partial [Bacteroidetes bacterium]|nr:T9SS type A sorting domain-containing protein [Bacteroidota bacterium]
KNDDILSFDIIDVLGKQIAVPISSNSNNIKLDISHLTSGLYFVCFRTQKKYFVKKIMKF